MKNETMIVESETVGPFGVNCYLVGCEKTKQAAVIDAGGGHDSILALASRHGLSISKLLLTHAHIDHIAGLGPFKERTKASIYLHPGDKPIYQTASMQGMMFGLKIDNPPAADCDLADGDIVEVGEIALKVIHTPGHSPGQVCFWAEEQGVIFVGDLIFAGSIGRVDLPGASPQEMKRSLNRLKELLPDDTVIYPGHMSSTTMGRERKTNPFLSGLMF